jgi:dTDP-4-dehydrorhamnose 3,5-epimerase
MGALPNPFELVDTGFPGLHVLRPRQFGDRRGSFVKTFHVSHFASLGISFVSREEFYSVSAKNVVRGMHFQLPPAAHAKLVYCPCGRAMDVVVDLRRQSPKFGRSYSRELNGNTPELVFIPAGFAHGFLSLQDDTIMVYQTDVVHTPECDAGIAWDSIGFEWPVNGPILSERDQRLPRLEDFVTPFNGGL